MPLLSTVTPCEPEAASAPLQPPEAVQEVALLLDQLSVLLWPSATAVGLAEKFTAGAGTPLTLTVFETVPPLPLQLRV